MIKTKLLALALVLVLVSCNKNTEKSSPKTSVGQPAGRIVYVNTDTLLNNYEYYKDVVKDFENKQFALENDLNRKGQSFQNEVALFQKRIQAGGMSEEQAKSTQLALQKKEQEIVSYRDNAASKLQQDQAKKTEELLSKINLYLKEYNKSDKYDMVIGYSKGGGVLYAKEDLDITNDVLTGLNEAYRSNQKEGASSDSTKNRK